MIKDTAILQPILKEDLIIKPVNGTQVIANAKKVFRSWIDHDFINWNLTKSSRETETIKVKGFTLAQRANFLEMFDAFSHELDNLHFTQHQIIEFCENYPEYISEHEKKTFFLIKENDNYLVVYVTSTKGHLAAHVYSFRNKTAWDVDNTLMVPVAA